jgi:hypothetical protein
MDKNVISRFNFMYYMYCHNFISQPVKISRSAKQGCSCKNSGGLNIVNNEYKWYALPFETYSRNYS